MWDFPVMDGVDFQDANRVHPLMNCEKNFRILQ